MVHLGSPADGGTAGGPVVGRGGPHVVGVAQDEPCNGGGPVVVSGGLVPEHQPAGEVVGVFLAGDGDGLRRVPVVCGEGQAGGSHRRPARRTLADGHGDVGGRLGRQGNGVGPAPALVQVDVGPAEHKSASGLGHVGKGGVVGRRPVAEGEQLVAAQVLQDHPGYPIATKIYDILGLYSYSPQRPWGVPDRASGPARRASLAAEHASR